MDFSQARSGDVGVNFSRVDRRVAEQLLDDAQIGAVFEKMRGEAMSQHVWRDVALDSRPANAAFDAPP